MSHQQSELSARELTPRNYQSKLIDIGKNQNTIIFLPTGTGKTFIAACITRELSIAAFAKKYDEGGKVTAFVVNTQTLVQQHSEFFRQNTPFSIGSYTGAENVDYWDKSSWQHELNKNNVLIMTAQIFLDGITKSFIDVNRINLIIFDECHRAVDAHCMRQIMMRFQNATEKPRVIGLTATLINGNVKDTKVVKEVKELESTFKSTVATVDQMSHLSGFSTNPKEVIEKYASLPSHLSDINTLITEKLMSLADLLSEIVPEDKATRSTGINLPLFDKQKPYNKYVKLIKDADVHFKMFGYPGARIACILYMLDLECEKRLVVSRRDIFIINSINTLFLQCKQMFERRMGEAPESERIAQYSSPKIMKLIQILIQYRDESDQDMCGIIFVQRKNTAIFLYHILKEFVQHFKQLSHLRPDFVIGYNSNPLHANRESMYYKKMNKKVINRFGSREVNLLIASNVVEEGLDIPNCTLVIKFDTPTNYTEYVQSKGRARHNTSLYYVMVEETNHEKFKTSYNKYQNIQFDLNKYLVGKSEEREVPNLDDMLDYVYEDEKPFYVNGPNSACFTMLSATQLLMSYCAKLPSDSYTVYEPTFFLDKVVNEQEKVKYKVVVELPLASDLLIDPIHGNYHNNKRDAKRSAAYKACIYLYECGELDSDLKPRRIEINENIKERLFSHWPSVNDDKAGITKTRRIYPKIVPKCVQPPIQNKVYLHVIDITRSQFYYDSNNLSYLYDSKLTYGLITTEQVPNLCGFPVYVISGQLDVQIRTNVATYDLSADHIRDIKEFHYLVFYDILKIEKTFLVMGENNTKHVYIVPVIRDENKIDFDALKNYKEIKGMDYEMSIQEKENLVVSPDTYLDKIVTPFYRMEDRDYVVVKVCDYLSAKTPFPNTHYMSYEHYFQEKYNRKTISPNLPLLLVKPLSSKLNYIKPRGANAKHRREVVFDNIDIHLIPEMCVKQEFPAALYIQARFLPTILHRFMQLLRADEIRSNIINDCPELGCLDNSHSLNIEIDWNLLKYRTNLPTPKPKEEVIIDDDVKSIDYNQLQSIHTINKEFNDKMYDSEYPWDSTEEPVDIKRDMNVSLMDIEYYMKFLHKKLDELKCMEYLSKQKKKKALLALDYPFMSSNINLLNKRMNGTGPELRLIYQALSTAKANDIVNLERLETLGDSYLKLIATLYVYLTFPKYNEGQATDLKGRLVSNKNLYYLGLEKNIAGYLKMNDLVPMTEWLPPGFCLPPQISKMINEKNIPITSLFHINIPREEQIEDELTDASLLRILEELKEIDVDNDDQNSFSSMCNYLGQHMVPDKTISDVVEALIGVFYSDSGFEGGLKIIEWFNVIPKSENFRALLEEPIKTPILNPDASTAGFAHLLPDYEIEQIEEIIGYKFKDPAFLLQALSHASYSTNRVTLSYQRIEFLGDSILDFLITNYIYETCETLTPGDLTDLRSALVNNGTFAAYIVKLGLHKYIKHFNVQAASQIMKFYTFQEKKDFAINDDVLILLNEDDLRIAENVDVPKILGDIFESLAGAIYLDSGKDLTTVWNIYYRIMWREISSFSRNIPKNPIRMLHERLAPIHPTYHNSYEVKSGKVMVKLDFILNGSKSRVHGFGENCKTAKKAAAKIALRLLSVKKK